NFLQICCSPHGHGGHLSVAMYGLSPASAKPPSTANRSFAQALNDACDVQISQLLVLAIRGEDLCIKITQHEYEKGLADCKKNIHDCKSMEDDFSR
ncbi:hypothetical protein A2U01_0030802, partial [Trifolium medium]|nr:hypothetical protein [Trifolium medium]